MTFDHQDDFEYERELLSLVGDFENKIKNRVENIFYDIDDWLDIIDFFIAEEPDNILLQEALTKATIYYKDNLQLNIRKVYCAAFDNPQEAYRMFCELEMKPDFVNTVEDAALLKYQKAKLLITVKQYKRAYEILNELTFFVKNQFIFEQLAVTLFKQRKYSQASEMILVALEETKRISQADEDITAYGAGDFLFIDTAVSDNLLTFAALTYKRNIKNNANIATAIEDLVKLHPFNTSYWEMLAEFYYRAEQYDKADEALDYCLCLRPSDINIYRKKLEICVNNFNKEKECEMLFKMIDLLERKIIDANSKEERNDILELWKGCLRSFISDSLSLKWFDRCLKVCEQSLKLNKFVPICDGVSFFSKGEIMIFMASCYIGKGEYERALNLSMNAVKSEPEYYGHRIRFAELLYDTGDVEQAEEIFQTLYEQCCEESAKTEFANSEEKETSIYFQKHKYYVVASWAVKMAATGRVFEAFDFISSNMTYDEKEFLNEIFIMKCAMIEVLSNKEGMEEQILDIIDGIVNINGLPTEAVLHKIPALYNNSLIIEGIKKINKTFDNE